MSLIMKTGRAFVGVGTSNWCVPQQNDAFVREAGIRYRRVYQMQARGQV